jgi:hypothetical protein
MLEVDGRRVRLKYAENLGCFRVVAHDKVVMPAKSEMIIRGAVVEMPVKNQLQGMLAVFEPLDRAQSKKNFEPSFVKIG